MRKRIIIFTGFINSGKTTMINNILATAENCGMKLMVIQCENGEISLLKDKTDFFRYSDFKSFKNNLIKDISSLHDIDTYLIEYNGTWSLSEIFRMNFPKNIVIEHIFYFLDVKTSLLYIENMPSMILEQMNYADTICFTNGSETTTNKRVLKLIKTLRKNSKLLNVDDAITVTYFKTLIFNSGKSGLFYCFIFGFIILAKLLLLII